MNHQYEHRIPDTYFLASLHHIRRSCKYDLCLALRKHRFSSLSLSHYHFEKSQRHEERIIPNSYCLRCRSAPERPARSRTQRSQNLFALSIEKKTDERCVKTLSRTPESLKRYQTLANLTLSSLSRRTASRCAIIVAFESTKTDFENCAGALASAATTFRQLPLLQHQHRRRRRQRLPATTTVRSDLEESNRLLRQHQQQPHFLTITHLCLSRLRKSRLCVSEHVLGCARRA